MASEPIFFFVNCDKRFVFWSLHLEALTIKPLGSTRKSVQCRIGIRGETNRAIDLLTGGVLNSAEKRCTQRNMADALGNICRLEGVT